MEQKKSKPTLRARADKIKDFRCKNLIAVIENPGDIRNIGTIIRNVNALGVEKAYVVTDSKLLPEAWEDMRTKPKLGAVSASAIKWSFVKVFKDTKSCLDYLEKKGFVSIVTSPHLKGRENTILHEHDYTVYKSLRSGSGTKAWELARRPSKEAGFASIFRCTELSKASIWGRHRGSCFTKSQSRGVYFSSI